MAYESYPPEKSTEHSPGLEDSRTPDSVPGNAPLAPESIPEKTVRVETHKTGDKVPAYDHVLDRMHGQVASYSAATIEADINAAKIKDPRLRGMKIAEVAKRRKEFVRA